MTTLLVPLPLMHLMCQIAIPEIPSFDNTNNIAAVPNQALLRPETPSLPEGYVSHPEIGVAYKIYYQEKTWTEARKLCLRDGAQLALIDSSTKLNILRSHNRTDLAPASAFRILSVGMSVGIHSFFGKDEWVSVKSGMPVGALPWAPGQPDGDHECVVMDRITRDGLNNLPCSKSHTYHFVCEIEIPT